jgi:hypothetical protein
MIAGLLALRPAEGYVHDSFQGHGLPVFHGRKKLPLAQSLDGVCVQLWVNTANKLNAVHVAVRADDGIQNHFPFDVLLY